MCWLLAFTLYSHGSAVALPGGGVARAAGVGAGVSAAHIAVLSFSRSVSASLLCCVDRRPHCFVPVAGHVNAEPFPPNVRPDTSSDAVAPCLAGGRQLASVWFWCGCRPSLRCCSQVPVHVVFFFLSRN